MGIQFERTELDKTISKLKKTINLECNTLALIDEDILAIRRKHEREAEEANFKLSQEVKQELANLEGKLSLCLEQIPGVFPDEITLLTNIAIRYF